MTSTSSSNRKAQKYNDVTSLVSCGLALPLVNNQRRPRFENVLSAVWTGRRVATHTVSRAQVKGEIFFRLVDRTTELTNELQQTKKIIRTDISNNDLHHEYIKNQKLKVIQLMNVYQIYFETVHLKK